MEERYTLARRTLGSGGWRSIYEYRLSDPDCRTLLVCRVSEGYLAGPVWISDGAGDDRFELSPNRAFMPSAWRLTDRAGKLVWQIRFGVLQSGWGGRYRVEDPARGIRYDFVGAETLSKTSRTRIAASLREHLVLCEAGVPVAQTGRAAEAGRGQPPSGLVRVLTGIAALARAVRGRASGAQIEAEFRTIDALRSVEAPPVAPELALLLLLFRQHYHRRRSF